MFRAQVCGALLLSLFVAKNAEAHFKLTAPASWTMESRLGDPQKQSPCGGEGGTPTNAVTTFLPGQTITIEFQETIYHPGHFRVALAANRADLIDPVMVIDANGNSVSAEIQAPPVPPVLVDGLFLRTANSGPSNTIFTQDITLPNSECRNCTLQIIQFMTGHGPPNYIYFHCATVDIVNPPPPDAGVVELDAGVIEPDAAEPDAGTTEADATVVYPDAAIEADAGEVGEPDAAEPEEDAGEASDLPKATTKTTGSCGCAAVPSTEEHGVWAMLLLLGLSLRGIRKRRS